MDIGNKDPAVEGVNTDEWTLQDEEARAYVRRTTDRIASLVRSTVGPYGSEKLVETYNYQDEPEVVLTADADQILAAIERGDSFNDPVAALFVDAVDSMQRGLGDGTATTLVLTDALVERGLDLVEDGVHPSTVVVGYAMAANRAGEVLDDLARECSLDDHDLLRRVASTAMTVDLDDGTRSRYAERVADAVVGLAEATDGRWLDTDDVDVIADTGVEECLYRGVVVQRHPSPVQEDEDSNAEFDWTPAVEGTLEDATVAIMDSDVSFGETATPLEESRLSSPTALEQRRTARADRRAAFADHLATLGVEVFVSLEEVEDDVRDALERERIAVVDRVTYPKSDVARVARATDASVVSHVDDFTPDVLGTAGRVRETVRSDGKWTFFDECDGGVFSLVVSADTASAATERERVVSKALEVTTIAAIDGQVIPGAGAPAAAVANDLRRYSRTVAGREQLAVAAFADALEDFLRLLGANAGLNPLDTLTTLRNAHADESVVAFGLDLTAGKAVDAWEAGVVEPRRVFSQAIETARSSTEQLLTVDTILYPNVDLESFSPELEHD
ncbi:TCP-1/cpn60 chaperonin family protein [Haladaptatus sp. NG-WS-4]